MPTTRERKIKFMKGFGDKATDYAIRQYMARNDLALVDLLTDEQLAIVASNMAADYRWTQRDNRRNRVIIAGKARPIAHTVPSAIDAAALHLAIATTAPAVRLAAAE